jgi:hypothetical protein
VLNSSEGYDKSNDMLPANEDEELGANDLDGDGGSITCSWCWLLLLLLVLLFTTTDSVGSDSIRDSVVGQSALEAIEEDVGFAYENNPIVTVLIPAVDNVVEVAGEGRVFTECDCKLTLSVVSSRVSCALFLLAAVLEFFLSGRILVVAAWLFNVVASLWPLSLLLLLALPFSIAST